MASFFFTFCVYYKNTSEILDFKKTVATDKEGNNVQVTYNITDA
jgi:hypothetical protein